VHDTREDSGATRFAKDDYNVGTTKGVRSENPGGAHDTGRGVCLQGAGTLEDRGCRRGCLICRTCRAERGANGGN
jgi:hypothetical protein